jgi:hypothetical protein
MVKEGGTTFTFVTDGIESALEQAKAAAGEAPHRGQLKQKEEEK